MCLTSKLPPLSNERVEMDERYHNLQFVNYSFVGFFFFLHGAKNKNFASWMLASRVLTVVSGHVGKLAFCS